MKRVYRIADKWKVADLWRVVLILRIWRDLHPADKNYLRDRLKTEP